MTTDAKVQIGLSTDFLEGTSVDTPAGTNLFREGVVVSDPEVAGARARITNTAPAADAYGLVVRIAGGGGGGSVSSDVTVINEVEVKNDAGNPLSVSGTVSVGNFPASQTVNGTVALDAASLAALETINVGNFPATQAVSGTVALDAATLAALETTTVSVNNFPATQAVSGSVTVTQATAANLQATVTGTVQANNLVGGTAVSNANPLPISDAGGSLTVDGTVSVGNFPATQAVSGSVTVSQATAANLQATVTGTVNVGNFPATQAVSGTVTANLGTLNGAATAANQTTGNTSLSSIDGKLPDLSGTWGYNAGTSGTLAVAANKRILAITATAPTLAAASMTINGGQTITIPAGTTITISPRANLTSPTLVFTSTTSYFVEFIE